MKFNKNFDQKSPGTDQWSLGRGVYDMQDEYIRTKLLIGENGFNKLKSSTVLVFGIGGVGSHCIEALARSGVGHLIIVDNDKVDMSNINRQSIAYHSTIGKYKTEVMKERIHDICPDITVDTFEEFILPDNTEEFFGRIETPDHIIDAIDTVSGKLAIAGYAVSHDIPVISSMGTGNKLHPEMFRIADISETKVCPLCRVMRRELKKRGIEHLKVLYSEEPPLKPEDKAKDPKGTSEDTAVSHKRSVPGSISFVPPVAGLMIAGEVIRELAGV